MSLFLVDADTPGFHKGRKLNKLGLKGQDTAELFFEDVRVPASALLGQVSQTDLDHFDIHLFPENILIFKGVFLFLVTKTSAEMIAGEQGVLPADGAAAPGATADSRPLHCWQRGHVRAHQGLGQREEGFRPPGGGPSDRSSFRKHHHSLSRVVKGRFRKMLLS